jgi:hypothetical protein
VRVPATRARSGTVDLLACGDDGRRWRTARVYFLAFLNPAPRGQPQPFLTARLATRRASSRQGAARASEISTLRCSGRSVWMPRTSAGPRLAGDSARGQRSGAACRSSSWTGNAGGPGSSSQTRPPSRGVPQPSAPPLGARHAHTRRVRSSTRTNDSARRINNHTPPNTGHPRASIEPPRASRGRG